MIFGKKWKKIRKNKKVVDIWKKLVYPNWAVTKRWIDNLLIIKTVFKKIKNLLTNIWKHDKLSKLSRKWQTHRKEEKTWKKSLTTSGRCGKVNKLSKRQKNDLDNWTVKHIRFSKILFTHRTLNEAKLNLVWVRSEGTWWGRAYRGWPDLVNRTSLLRTVFEPTVNER